MPHSRGMSVPRTPRRSALCWRKARRAGIACIVSGVMSLVMIVLALLPVRPPP